MKLQDIFDLCISKGYYADTFCSGMSSEFMCNSLELARYNGHLSEKEVLVGQRSIRKYLNGMVTLDTALNMSGLPSFNFKYRLGIYKNWKRRPKLKV